MRVWEGCEYGKGESVGGCECGRVQVWEGCECGRGVSAGGVQVWEG